jgi:hypothetical protein
MVTPASFGVNGCAEAAPIPKADRKHTAEISLFIATSLPIAPSPVGLTIQKNSSTPERNASLA